MSEMALDARTGFQRQSGTLTGTIELVRFALRRDRIWLPVWIVGIALSLVVTALSLPPLYPDDAARAARADLMGNPAAIAMSGPQIGVEDYTLGAMMTNEMLGFTAIFVALMSILLVVRHTRSEEEAGRTELIRAAAVGRNAPLAAALVMAVIANLGLMAAIAVGLASLQIESVDVVGSCLFAAALAMVGLVFAAVTAVTVQVTESARTATGMALLVLGVAYILRAVGDIGNGFLSWLSPIGWAQRTYAYVDDRWWPVLLGLAAGVLLMGVAVGLSGRRDVGAGLRPARPGPARASDRLGSPLGLALRLQRGSIIGWTLAMMAFGLVYGTLLGDIETFAGEMSAIEDILADLGGAIIDAFLALVVSMLAMVAAIFSVLAIQRARTEEIEGRAEPLLATPVSRNRWLASHVAVAAGGGVVILLGAAVGLGVTGAIVLGDASVMAEVLAASLVYVAPMLLTIAIAVALFGLVPRASQAVWLVLVYAFFSGVYGGLLNLPAWTLNLSPFAVVPMLPAEDLAFGPILATLLLAGLIGIAGFAGFRRRDLAGRT